MSDFSCVNNNSAINLVLIEQNRCISDMFIASFLMKQACSTLNFLGVNKMKGLLFK